MSTTQTLTRCDWCATPIGTPMAAGNEDQVCTDCHDAWRRGQERVTKSVSGDRLLTRLGAALPMAALVVSLCIGGAGLDRAAVLYQQHRVTYTVQMAGEADGTSVRRLVDAEYYAHRWAGNPETEQERGRAVLIIDQDGKLIDTVTR